MILKELILDYRESLEKIQISESRLMKKKQRTELEEEDLRVLRSMRNDLYWVITWLEDGREPGPQRSITNRAGYQREILWSQLTEKGQRQIEWMESQRVYLEPKENKWLEKMLDLLSKSEYESFVAVRGEGLSFAQAASLLNCSKSAVQSYVRRAEEKIRKVCKLVENPIQNSSADSRKIVAPSYQTEIKRIAK